jgi:hypothetical protein
LINLTNGLSSKGGIGVSHEQLNKAINGNIPASIKDGLNMNP